MNRLLPPLAALLLVPGAAFAQPAAAPAAATDLVQLDHVSIEAIGSGPPLVLIPGLATPREVFRPFVEALARDHRVLLVQVNGFAGDPPRANAQGGIITGAAADIAAYLERSQLGPAAVVGHSMGGLIGMVLARDHADRLSRLMIVDSLPFIGSLFMPDPSVDAIRPGAEQMRAAIAAGATRQAPVSADDPGVATMSITPAGRLQVSGWSHTADPLIIAQAFYEDATMDLRADLPAIARVPTTVLFAAGAPVGERARTLFTAEYAPAPSVRLVPVPDSYHFIMLDQPEAFRRALQDFLGAR